jgi:hypothetical protein
MSRKEHSKAMQRLSPGEEEALRDWIVQLATWGWPVHVWQLNAMASALLLGKGDTKPLGINWTQAFLERHPTLKSRFITGLDKERALAQHPDIIQDWFNLFERVRNENGVHPNDCWNMDEKGVMLGMIGKSRCIIPKEQKKQYMTQPGDREWSTLTECISMTGRVLPPWIIFKAKMMQKAWKDALRDPDARVCLSENGWTDNYLGLKWFEEHFQPHTKITTGTSGWRILVYDGHQSHVTISVIQFCIKHSIALLCLPPHSTHILQPLDIKLFSPLQTAYQKELKAKSRFQGQYHVDKVEFLEILQNARDKAFTTKNILSGWEAAGLSPFNPEVILNTLPSVERKPSPSKPQSVSLAITSETGDPIFIPLTPSNSKQVKDILDDVLQSDLDPVIALRLQKICKATDKAMADSQIQRTTSNVLLEAVNERKARKNRKNQAWGYARIMNADFLFNKQQEADEKEYEATIKAFDRLGPSLFNEVAGKKDLVQEAKQAQRALRKANASAAPRKISAKPIAATNKTPRRRGRPSKLPVPVAVAVAPELAPETRPISTRVGRKIKVPVPYESQ